MLSDKDKTLLVFAANGFKHKDSAAQLQTTEQVIKNMWQRLFDKMGAANMTQAVAMAIAVGVIKYETEIEIVKCDTSKIKLEIDTSEVKLAKIQAKTVKDIIKAHNLTDLNLLVLQHLADGLLEDVEHQMIEEVKSKLEATTTMEAVVKALRYGLID